MAIPRPIRLAGAVASALTTRGTSAARGAARVSAGGSGRARTNR